MKDTKEILQVKSIHPPKLDTVPDRGKKTAMKDSGQFIYWNIPVN